MKTRLRIGLRYLVHLGLICIGFWRQMACLLSYDFKDIVRSPSREQSSPKELSYGECNSMILTMIRMANDFSRSCSYDRYFTKTVDKKLNSYLTSSIG